MRLNIIGDEKTDIKTKSTLNIQVKEIPNFEDEEDVITDRVDIEKYPTKKVGGEMTRSKKHKPFEIEKNKIDEFEDDFEDTGRFLCFMLRFGCN